MVTALGMRKKELEVPKKNGKRIERIIKRGIVLKQRFEDIKQQIEQNNQALLPHAENLTMKTGLKSAVFKSIDGMVTVKFSDSVVYDDKDMKTIREILGPLFIQMFHEVPKFAVNTEDIPEIMKRLGKDSKRLIQVQATFKHTKELLSILSDGDSDLSRKLRDYIFIEPKKPSITFENVSE